MCPPKGKKESQPQASISGAEKKLRQASFFLRSLEFASRQRTNPEHLEFYFSACLTAAQSAFYVMDKSNPRTFKSIEPHWRSRLTQEQRTTFHQMIRHRDDDVHYGSTSAELLEKAVAEPPGPQQTFFGADEVVEETNPDGTKVRGSALRYAPGLYIERQDRRIDAVAACREFIERLQSLLEEMKAAPPGGSP